MLRDLLVHIPSERPIRPVVDAAVSLAMTHAAHLDAVSIGFEYTNVDLAPDGGAAIAALLEIEQERALARANVALAVFEAEARNAGISYGLQPLTGVPAEAAATVSALARLHELTIVLQPEPSQDTSDNTVPQEILFQSGSPVLFIPYTHKGPFEPKHIGIAWDGSRVAARALRDAAPFLARAQAITIISVNDADIPADVSVAALETHLTRRALTARVERMKADRADIQPTILSVAADTGLDMIVMGGYGHSRLSERILGGVTRGMLQSMTVPTLMSHSFPVMDTTPQSNKRVNGFRRRVYVVLEQGSGGASLTLNRFLIVLIGVTLTATVIESVPDMARTYALPLSAIEWAATLIFSLEYAARLWSAAEHPLLKGGAFFGRLRFALSFSGLVDLVAILPFWLSIFIASDFRVLLVLRLVRFFKLTRYSPAMRSLLDALYSERRALAGCFVILLGTALIPAALMHLAERAAQPERFGTIPDALWWAIVTLGTIGYGDVVPVTVLGRILASFTIFAGLLMMALPVGIFATAFANEVHRRDFIITWGLVARIPLFRTLTASEIADVMTMLRAQKVDSGTVIARRGEPAHAMYLIADGEVEVKLRHKHLRLSTGQFFGEIAALRRTRRSATVTAVTPTRLLVLDALDLHGLMDRQPALAARIEEAARAKLGHELNAHGGDIVTEELHEVSSD